MSQDANDPAPSVQHLLGAAGAPAEIHAAGKVWKIGPPTQQAGAVLEELVAQFARKMLLKAGVPESTWADRVAAGEYETLGDGWRAIVLKSVPAGLILTLQSLLRANHPDVTYEQVRALWLTEQVQTLSAFRRVAPGFFTAVLAPLGMPADQMTDLLAATPGGSGAAASPTSTPS